MLKGYKSYCANGLSVLILEGNKQGGKKGTVACCCRGGDKPRKLRSACLAREISAWR